MRRLQLLPTSSEATRQAVAVIIGACGLLFVLFVLWKLRRKLSCCYRRPRATCQDEVLALAAQLYGKEAEAEPPLPPSRFSPRFKAASPGLPGAAQHMHFSIKAFPGAHPLQQHSPTPETSWRLGSGLLQQPGSPPRTSLLSPTTQQLGCRWSPSGPAPSAPPPSPGSPSAAAALGEAGLGLQLSSGPSETSRLAAANLQRLASLLGSGGQRGSHEGGPPSSSPSLVDHRRSTHPLSDSGAGPRSASFPCAPSTSQWSPEAASLSTAARSNGGGERQSHFSLLGSSGRSPRSLTGPPGGGNSKEWLLGSCDKLDGIAELPSEGKA